jgi:hypothetical protein
MNGSTTVPAGQRLTVTLEAGQWNLVMQAINDLPYRLAAPLVPQIMEQFQAQTAGSSGVAGNGLDHHPPATDFQEVAQ